MPYWQSGYLHVTCSNRFADAVPLMQRAPPWPRTIHLSTLYLADVYLDLGEDLESTSVNLPAR